MIVPSSLSYLFHPRKALAARREDRALRAAPASPPGEAPARAAGKQTPLQRLMAASSRFSETVKLSTLREKGTTLRKSAVDHLEAPRARAAQLAQQGAAALSTAKSLRPPSLKEVTVRYAFDPEEGDMVRSTPHEQRRLSLSPSPRGGWGTMSPLSQTAPRKGDRIQVPEGQVLRVVYDRTSFEGTAIEKVQLVTHYAEMLAILPKEGAFEVTGKARRAGQEGKGFVIPTAGKGGQKVLFGFKLTLADGREVVDRRRAYTAQILSPASKLDTTA
jgi:hypothetical protein